MQSKRCFPCALQDDLLYESLTVYEVLYYAAMLRLPRTMSVADKIHRVDTVIKALGLDTCRDTIIGEACVAGVGAGWRRDGGRGALCEWVQRLSCGLELTRQRMHNMKYCITGRLPSASQAWLIFFLCHLMLE